MTWINAGGPTTGPADNTDEPLSLAQCRARLDDYQNRTRVYGSGTEKALHDIARGLLAEVDYWRGRYRGAADLSDDEPLDADEAWEQDEPPHPAPCRYPHSPACGCESAVVRDA